MTATSYGQFISLWLGRREGSQVCDVILEGGRNFVTECDHKEVEANFTPQSCNVIYGGPLISSGFPRSRLEELRKTTEKICLVEETGTEKFAYTKEKC
jgi:hypothetical protein